jgi:serine kinase of HPr protein (carbohydrate metabolism regulator)
MPRLETVHACCVVVGERGLLIRGASGSGKSTLARGLVADAGRAGLFAAHVADDRTRVESRHGRILARPVPEIGGKLEVRGLGILPVPHEPAAVIHLVVDLSSEPPPRLPGADEGATTLCGIAVARLPLRSGTPCSDLILAWARKRELTLMAV